MDNKVLAIIGAGDLGKQIAHLALSDNHYSQVVFFDDYINLNQVEGNIVIGKIRNVLESFENNKFDELIIAIGYNHFKFRAELYHFFNGQKIPFGRIIHTTSWIDSKAEIKNGVVIYPDCIIDANVLIGFNTILNLGCTISHDTEIGAHCFIAPRVAIAGFSKIGEQSFLGINSTIIDNLSICNNTQIGAGAVVVKNIEKSGVYVGNPAKFLR
jgi:sugar O-acyltransferase (sialic acid O-acetyltransferase NeuD family)